MAEVSQCAITFAYGPSVTSGLLLDSQGTPRVPTEKNNKALALSAMAESRDSNQIKYSRAKKPPANTVPARFFKHLI